MLKFFQFIGSVFTSVVIALLVPYAIYRFSPDMWISLQIHIGFAWTFGTLFFCRVHNHNVPLLANSQVSRNDIITTR